MNINFNFITESTENLSFSFGSQAELINFNFTAGGYVPNSNLNFGFTIEILNILMGRSNNFTSVWVYNGKMYVGSNNYLNVVDLDSKLCTDYYTTSNPGHAGEVLDHSEVSEINVVG